MGFEIENGVLKQYIKEPGVTEVIIPDSVKRIRDGVFSYHYELISVVIPEGVPAIPRHAFLNCCNLVSVSVPDSVTKIRRAAFTNCGRLSSFRIPDRVTEIGNASFQNCRSLGTIAIPDSVTQISAHAFEGCQSVSCDGVTFSQDPNSRTPFNKVIYAVRDMIRTKNYSIRISNPVKYAVLWQLFCRNPDDEALFDYLKKHFPALFRFAIDSGNTDAVNAVCRKGGLLMARNIDRFITYAIEQKQTEIQLMLMNEKDAHIGYAKKRFSL